MAERSVYDEYKDLFDEFFKKIEDHLEENCIEYLNEGKKVMDGMYAMALISDVNFGEEDVDDGEGIDDIDRAEET